MKMNSIEKTRASKMIRGKDKTNKDIKISSEWKIQNVVSTVSMKFDVPEGKANLTDITRRFPECEYNPERFPGLIMRLTDPKSTALIFSTGNMVVTGLKEESLIEGSVSRYIDNITRSGISLVGEPEIRVQNIVASGDLHVPIDLNDATIILNNAVYEPEVFPGLIYRMENPKAVFLIFATGKVVCTGVKKREDVDVSMKKLERVIIENGLIAIYDNDERLDFI